MGHWKSLSRSILTGLFLGLSFFSGFDFLIFIALVPLFFNWTDSGLKLKDYFLNGFLAQFVFIAIGFHWIQAAGTSYFLLGSVTSFLFYFAFVVLFSLHWGVIGFLFGYFNQTYRKFLILTLPIFMISLDEIIFKFIPLHFGFHWFAGHFPGVTWASLIGLNGLGFLVLWINLFFVLLLRRRFIKVALAGFIIVTVFVMLSPQIEKVGEPFKVLGVQGNISNEIKRTDLQVIENKMMTVDKYYSLSRKGLKENPNVDLIVWPDK